MAKEKGIIIAIVIVVAVLVAGAGAGLAVYWWQKSAINKKSEAAKKLQSKLNQANKTIKKLKSKAAKAKKKSQDESQQKAAIQKAPEKKFGYIKQVYDSSRKTYLKVDYATMLTGEEANKAAIEAGEIQPGETVPNDYYITNVNPAITTLVISPSVTITAQTYNMSTTGKVGDQSISLAKFKYIFQTKPSNNDNMVRNPYWLTVTGDTVTKIKEQYLP